MTVNILVRERYNRFIERHEAAWELTFALLALLFVVVGIWPLDSADADSVLLVGFEWGITAIFAAEFISRLAASHDRRAYLRAHWIDAVAVIPLGRGLRLLRLVRLIRLVRAFAGIARALERVEAVARHRALLWIGAAWAAVMVICSAGLYLAEVGVNPAVREPMDAVWWGITTMTTVGYGDVYPITAEGRLAASALMILGIALYSAITATLTSVLLTRSAPSSQDPAMERLRQLAAEHRAGQFDADEYLVRLDEVLRASTVGAREPR